MVNKKNKKNLHDFQSALLSNTPFIKQGEEQVHASPEGEIDPDLLEKIKALAQYEKTTESSLLNKAISHFLRLKGLELEEALKQYKK